MSGKKWTKEEDEFLKNNYLNMTCREMGIILGRTTTSTQQRYNRLGLEKPSPKIGDKFNRLTILDISLESVGEKTASFAICLCECGNKIKTKLSPLYNGRTLSCGCVGRESASQRMRKYNTKYPQDLIKHPLYENWQSMRKRYDREWIDAWDDFSIFYEWAIHHESYQTGLRLTRLDKSLPYSPENCRFVPQSEIVVANIDVEKAKQTCLERYGVDNYNKTEESKSRSIKRNLTKYGFESHLSSPEIQKKIKETNLEKYGTQYPTQSIIIKEKIQTTCLEKYGAKAPAMNHSIKAKARATCLEKYGFESSAQNSEIKEKQIATIIERYGRYPYNGPTGKTENNIRLWLESFGYDFPSNYQILDGKEIDMYSNELKLGIEYCGIYWYTENSPEPRDRNYHFSKYKKCLEQDVRLITVFSDEFLNREYQVKNFLKSVLGKFDIKVFARKCECIEIDRHIGGEFVEQHHILGCKVMSKVYFGLIYEDRLIGVTSLRLHHRNSKEIVLDRMCFADGVSVVGGASKMLSRCIEWCKNNGFNEIVSWSDNRYSQGNVYEKIGFVLDGELRPDYSYVHKNKKERISKQSMRVPAGVNEKEYAESIGFSRIWDCGKKRYVYKIK